MIKVISSGINSSPQKIRNLISLIELHTNYHHVSGLRETIVWELLF